MLQVCFWRNSALSLSLPTPFFFPMNAYKKCPVAVGATQRSCLSTSRGLWLLWILVVFHSEFGTDLAWWPWCFLLTLCISHLLGSGVEKGGQRVVTKQQRGSFLSVSGWMNSCSVWRHWAILDTQSSESQKVFGRGERQWGEGSVGIQPILFQKLFVLNLDIICDSLGVSQQHQNISVLVSRRWRHILSVLPFITAPAQQLLVPTSAVLLQQIM